MGACCLTLGGLRDWEGNSVLLLSIQLSLHFTKRSMKTSQQKQPGPSCDSEVLQAKFGCYMTRLEELSDEHEQQRVEKEATSLTDNLTMEGFFDVCCMMFFSLCS